MAKSRLKSRRGPRSPAALRERVAELERERELLNAIANYAPSLICLVDGEGRVRPFASNRAFEQILGYAPHETGGELFWEKYVADGERAAARDCILSAIRLRAQAECEGRWLQRDGSEIDVVWTCTPLPKISSGPVYLVSGTDVTERKRHEAEVRRSRARIVAASDDARRRLERNLHDGAQQRLLALLLQLRAAQRGLVDAPATLDLAVDELAAAVKELRSLAQGIHPAALTERGLAAALRIVAARSPVPVELDVTDTRFDTPITVAAYYIVSEALANVAKYAEAERVAVRVRESDDRVVVVVEDDGKGGADPFGGTGLSGLGDRVAALDGSLDVQSPPGGGTRIRAELPLQ
jgi:PAS domain S-box-containing protein